MPNTKLSGGAYQYGCEGKPQTVMQALVRRPLERFVRVLSYI